MRHAVTHRLHVREVRDHAVRGVGQRFQHETYTRRMVGDRHAQLELILARGLVSEASFGETDAIDQTFGQKRVAVVVDVDNLIFDRRAAAIEN